MTLCYECHHSELALPIGDFRAVRCAECAARWAWEKWSVA